MSQNPSVVPEWRVQPAPCGPGLCLMSFVHEATDILAPRGVRLRRGDSTDEIQHWRFGRWENGEILVDSVRPLELPEVLSRAPDEREWIDSRERYWFGLLASLSKPAVGPPLTESQACERLYDLDGAQRIAFREMLLRRPPALAPSARAATPVDELTIARALTTSATALARYLGGLPENSLLRTIGRCAACDSSLVVFRDHLEGLAVSQERLVVALALLLHGRANSHTWRVSTSALVGPLRRFRELPVDGVLSQALGRLADELHDPDQFQQEIAARYSEQPEATYEALVTVFHARSQSRRWRGTRPIRKIGATPAMAPLRGKVTDLRELLLRLEVIDDRRTAEPGQHRFRLHRNHRPLLH